MAQDWMIDVLSDLRSFAVKNGLPALAEQLDDTIHVAVAELAAAQAHKEGRLPDAKQDGDLHRALARSDNP